MKNQVLSIEQMQELKELGIDIIHNASCEWMHTKEYGWTFTQIGKGEGSDEEYIPTLTLQDILEMLPENITADCGVFQQVKFSLQIHYGLLEYSTPKLGLHTEIVSKKETSPLLQAAFNMLKWCKQNNYI